MKIAIVTETYPPEINGVALTLQGFVCELAALGHDISLIRPHQATGSTAPENVREYLTPGIRLPRYSELRFGLPVRRRIRGIFEGDGVEAVYIATEGPLGWAALKESRRLGLPTLSGFHTRFDQYVSHYGIGFAEKAVGGYLRRFHNACDGTLVPTRGLQQDLTAAGYQNVRVLERAVDVDRFSPRYRSDELRRQWGLDEHDLGVLYVGRIAAEKNLDLAIETYRNIESQSADRCRFILVGDGPEAARVQAANPDFIMAGRRTGEDLSAHYASGDMFVFPSLTDTFGNVVLESLASAVPVVAFDCAAAHDFIVHGENGFVAPPGDNRAFMSNAAMLGHLAVNLPDLRAAARHSVAHLRRSSVARRLAEAFCESPGDPSVHHGGQLA